MGADWATALDIFVSPGEAFERLRERPRILFPLLILVVLSAGVVYWYYSAVDLAWMIETQMPDAMPADQPTGALEGSGMAAVIGIVAAVSAGAGLLLGLLVSAGYLAFISMLTNDGYRFRQWFSLVCWCSLPMVLGQLATGVNLLVSDVSRLPPEQLNPLSFANLLGLDAGSGESGNLVMTLSPTALWALILVVLGYHSWTRRSVATAAAIVLGPPIVIAGLVLMLR